MYQDEVYEPPLRDCNYFQQADLCWVLLMDYSYVFNYPPKLTIHTEYDKDIVFNIVFTDQSYAKINKLFDQNYVRKRVLDSKMLLERNEYVLLQIFIKSVGLEYFRDLCQKIGNRITYRTTVESMYMAYKFCNTACDSLLSEQRNACGITSLNKMRRKFVDEIIFLKSDELF